MKSPAGKFIILCVFFLYGVAAAAQKFNFKNYSVVNGLGGSSVNNIFQDSRGYIWFGIQGGGVSRFNGKEFKTFTKSDGLIDNDVTYIAEDKLGHIWIATAAGASEFDGLRFRNYNGKNGLTDAAIYGIYADDHGKVWFATKGSGVKVYDHNHFDSITARSGLPSDDVYSITQDKSGKYWLGLSNGIATYDGHKITSCAGASGIKDKTFFSSLIAQDGSIWFGSTSGEVFVFSADGVSHKFELPVDVKGSFLASIAQDRRGNIWFSTDFGLLKYSDHHFKLFTERDGLSINVVQCVYTDYEDHVWTGTLGGGVNLLSSEAFASYTDKDGLSSNNVTGICRIPPSDFYYVGTGNGLFVFQPNATPKFKKVNVAGLPDGINISSLSLDHKGQLWITAQTGIFVLNTPPGSQHLVKSYTTVASQSVISPLQAIHDGKGKTWIATFGSGLMSISDGEQLCQNVKNGFPSDKILSVFEDSKANIWIGTQDAGVVRYDGQRSEHFSVEKGFPDRAVWSMVEDKNGNIFFGTGEKGLCRYDGKAFRTYTTKDGLCSNAITALAWDQYEDALWLGAEKGVNKIAFDQAGKMKNIRSYNEHDGFNSGGVNQNAILIDRQASAWLGAINGLWLFDGHLDQQQSVSPKIALTEIRMAYQKVDWKSYADSIDSRTNLPYALRLAYRKKYHLVFDIQAMTTDDVWYTFKLDGYDESWSPLTKNNEISYANINPGQQYTFHARAVNSKGVSSSETVPFTFSVDPPWWATWWFRIVAVLLGVAVVSVIVTVRERVLRQQNVKLEETVVQRTLEIAQQKKIVEERNEKITRQKELVEQTLSEKEVLLGEKEVLLREIHHRVKNNLQTISSMLMLQGAALKDEQSKKVIIESQNRVRSIALVHQKLYQTDGLEKVEFNVFVHDLTEQIMSVYRDQSQHVSITYDIPETYLLIDTAIPFGLILNELLTNSFKYAFNENPNGEIRMTLTYIDSAPQPAENKALMRKTVQFAYRDSGPGLRSEAELQSATTLGLRLIRLLSQQIGAKLSYSSAHGSEFIFTFAFSS